jgi:hypothetical protein
MKTKSVLKTVVMTVALLNSLSAIAAEPACGTQASLEKVTALAARELAKFEEKEYNRDTYKGISDIAQRGGNVDWMNPLDSENLLAFYRTQVQTGSSSQEASGVFQCDAKSGKITLLYMYIHGFKATDHGSYDSGSNIRGPISE